MSEEYDYIPEYEYRNDEPFHKDLIEFEKALETFKRSLLGMKRNNNYGHLINVEEGQGLRDMNAYIAEEGAGLVNRKGAIAIFNFMLMKVNKITRSTNLTNDVIANQMQAFVETLGSILIENYDEWQIKNFEMILEEAQDPYYYALCSSKEGFLMDMISSATRIAETVQQDNEEKKKIFGLPFGIGGGK